MSARAALVLVLTLAACDRPAGTMRDQPRNEAYEYSPFFDDYGSARHRVRGTVAREAAHDGCVPPLTPEMARDPARPPAALDPDLLARGRDRFRVHCVPCHGADGRGDGAVVAAGYPRPPSYHEGRLRRAPDRHLFDVATNGLGKMPPYGPHVSPHDLWAIVAHVRVLQLAGRAPLDAAPADVRARLLEEGG